MTGAQAAGAYLLGLGGLWALARVLGYWRRRRARPVPMYLTEAWRREYLHDDGKRGR